MSARFNHISFRDGLLEFSLPDTWVVEMDDESGIFYDDREDSGTLRLNVLTLEHADVAALDDLDIMFANRAQQYAGSYKVLDSGDAVLRYDARQMENGEELFIRYWQLGNLIPSAQVRLAMFSYTLMASQLGDARVQEELHWLETEIEQASFSS